MNPRAITSGFLVYLAVDKPDLFDSLMETAFRAVQQQKKKPAKKSNKK